MFDKLKSEYRASLKSKDTEEHIDLAFYRPIGFLWAKFFEKLHVTPNVVTIASIFIGVGAGICFYYPTLGINIVGILLLILANSYDSADGQLARLTGQYSRLGRILDGMAGDLWFLSIYIAICLRTNIHEPFFAEHPALIWIMGSLAGLCHARQAAMADYFRQFHLYFVKKSFPSELERSADLKTQFDSLSWKNPFQKVAMALYYGYTKLQEKTTPNMQAVLTQIRTQYSDGQLPEGYAEKFRIASLPLCKWENFMTFNWRSIFLFLSIIVGYPWLYFAAELTLFNVVYFYTISRHEKICKSFIR